MSTGYTTGVTCTGVCEHVAQVAHVSGPDTTNTLAPHTTSPPCPSARTTQNDNCRRVHCAVHITPECSVTLLAMLAPLAPQFHFQTCTERGAACCPAAACTRQRCLLPGQPAGRTQGVRWGSNSNPPRRACTPAPVHALQTNNNNKISRRDTPPIRLRLQTTTGTPQA